MPPAEHGGQHGVLVAPQRGQPSGEVCAPDVQGDDLRELENGTKVVNRDKTEHWIRVSEAPRRRENISGPDCAAAVSGGTFPCPEPLVCDSVALI